MNHSNSPKLRLNHKEMYKSPLRIAQIKTNLEPNALFSDDSQSASDFPSVQSPSWRDAYKKRCFDEFKKSRQKLVNRFRNFKVNFCFIFITMKCNTFKRNKRIKVKFAELALINFIPLFFLKLL
jgi:hypothetical protein